MSARDDEALRRSEDKFAKAFRASPDSVTLTNLRTGELLDINEGFERLFEWTREEALGKTTLELGLWADPAVREAFVKRMHEHGRVRDMEVDGATKTGKRVRGLVSAETIHVGDEPLVVLIVRDVTDLRKAEADRERMRVQLGQAQKMEAIGRLAGGVAHDFNNLLTVIGGNVVLARRALPPGHAVLEQLAEIEKAVDTAASLTRQLLAFSRRQVVTPKVVDPNDVIRQFQKTMGRLLGEDLRLVLRLGTDAGHVRMDPGQLEQILVNLTVNARDAMPGGGELRIETAAMTLDAASAARHAGARPGPHVLVAVTDEGTGMSDEVKQHLFEPFFTTKEHGKGTGLGLALVYGVAKQNGGFVTVDSEVGRGTRFEVWLPRVDTPASSVAGEPDARPRGGSETIVLVEDEEMVRSVAVRLLRMLGYHVHAFAGGAVALEALRALGDPVDLLVTDVVMPGMNGRVLAERLTAERPGLKVLYTSGYTEDVLLQHLAKSRGIEFLPKPYTADQLARRVRAVLDGGPE